MNRSTEKLEKLQTRMMDRLLKANPAFLAECEFRPVRSAVELKLAAHLVYLEYFKKNYTAATQGELRLSLFQFLQNSATLVAIYQKKYILGTISILEDSALGLPMDKIYRKELNVFRTQRRKLFEAGMLAMNDHILGGKGWQLSPNDRMVLVLHLFKATVHYFRHNTDRDMMLACFHPKHEFFYRGIHMEPFAGVKNHEIVQGSPAVGYLWDIARMDKKPTGAIEKFFGFGTPKEQPYSVDRRLKLKFDEFGEMFLSSR